MNFSFPPGLAPIRRWAEASGLEIYIVGGWVRDSLLGLPAWDADLCGPHLPGELTNCLPEDGSVTLHTRDAGLGTVELHAGGEVFEYTAFRRESYRPGGAHRPTAVTLGATMEEDALRRDFTVNAMYLRITDSAFFDPTGGMRDLPRHTLSTTRAPDEVLNEDGLRLLRLVRQSAELEFSIAPETYAAAKAHIAYLGDIAPERLREELRRILCADLRHPEKVYAASPVLAGLEWLHDLGAWRYLCPAGESLCADPARMRAAALAPAHDVLRLACLWHSLAPQTLEACCQALRFSREDARLTALLCEHAAVPLCEEAFRLCCAHAGREDAQRLTTLRSVLREVGLSPADARESSWLQDMLEENVPFSLKEVMISGKVLTELLGGPSPRVGRLKARLFDHCILSPLDNSPERLYALARDILAHETL